MVIVVIVIVIVVMTFTIIVIVIVTITVCITTIVLLLALILSLSLLLSLFSYWYCYCYTCWLISRFLLPWCKWSKGHIIPLDDGYPKTPNDVSWEYGFVNNVIVPLCMCSRGYIIVLPSWWWYLAITVLSYIAPLYCSVLYCATLLYCANYIVLYCIVSRYYPVLYWWKFFNGNLSLNYNKLWLGVYVFCVIWAICRSSVYTLLMWGPVCN